MIGRLTATAIRVVKTVMYEDTKEGDGLMSVVLYGGVGPEYFAYIFFDGGISIHVHSNK